MKSRGKTVFLNSHLLSEVEMICDEVAIINRGRIITQGKLSSLLESGTSMEARISKPSKDLVKDLSGRATQMEIDGNILRFKVKDRQDIPEIVKAIVNSGTLLYELKPVNGSLEEFFVNLLKEGK
jgi:ABC-2 type transport system ATP-binding protein